MWQFRKILLPFSWLYGWVIRLRHLLYDKGFIKAKSYSIPIICIGNLSVGGTGKTPMTEYFINLLKTDFNIAVLSRGYKRKSKGFLLADQRTTVEMLGDEPFQYYTKFKGVHVAVDADRQHGIETLQKLCNPDCVILDDAFQHRKVVAGMNILLTTYNDLYVDDLLLPAGNLRDVVNRADNADVIVVTKCPEKLSKEDKDLVTKRIGLCQHQKIYFSKIVYSTLIYSERERHSLAFLKGNTFTLVTGIANPQPLTSYLESLGLVFEHIDYPDHHHFSEKEISILKERSLILTTEKDYVRLKGRVDNLFFLPIHNEFLFEEGGDFDHEVLNYIKKA
ncbi:tetraacyldisaccharide 4'-kinase [Zhouia amylolytica]|uniref:Tetraacyldisaccharide 4'-kinase n=1 Tax=Zhouia amylolytica AD3 TaxID=1286632 RepID=W2USB1_9FLAO|nr:tetraacyldisaccharide 4'-kinase [Zhouia amylolytica]ETN96834.1 tetraacyldisaccharide 4''-kinase [Zhouia amylolytica AD3]